MGNGVRGLRATPSPKLIALLRQQYDFDLIHEVRDLGGSCNLNLLLTTHSGRYVARVYRPYVRAARLEAIQSAWRVLAQGGIPCAQAVLTSDGAPWIEFDGRLIEVERFVAYDNNMDTGERLEVGLPWLGHIHSLLRTVIVPPEGKQPLFANHIEPSDTLAGTLRGTRRVREWGATPRELRLIAAAEALAHEVTEAERAFVASLPRQLVHGDFWDNNVLFREGQVVLVTDLDFMGERARLDDLALTLYYTHYKFSEDPVSSKAPVSEEHLARLRRLVDAYNDSLDIPLTPVERMALPPAIARQPLFWIGRYLPILDDEEVARRGFAGMERELECALQVLREGNRWQGAFA
jgi:Ser/Thr protein kinase RdoA (MazF antagonist)